MHPVLIGSFRWNFNQLSHMKPSFSFSLSCSQRVSVCGCVPVSATSPSTKELSSFRNNSYEVCLLSKNVYWERRAIIDCADLLFCGFVPEMHVCAPVKFFFWGSNTWKDIRKIVCDDLSFFLKALGDHCAPKFPITQINKLAKHSFSVHSCTTCV